MAHQRLHIPLRIISLGLACIALAFDAQGERASRDPLVDVWDTEDGLPNSTVTAVAQTRDGYLWVGTYDGLARFDGLRFVTFDPVNTPELRNARIQALFVDSMGTLWINTYRGALTSYRDGVFYSEGAGRSGYDLHTTLAYSTSNEIVFVGQSGEVMRRPLVGPPVWTIKTRAAGAPVFQCAGLDGALWFTTREGQITRFIDGQFIDLPGGGGLTNHVLTLVADSRGRIWAGADNEIAFWNGHQFENMTPTNGEPNFEPSSIFPTRSGALWVLSGDQLREQNGRQWIAEATAWRGLLGFAGGRAMGAHEDSEGGIWFNHYGNGVFHITPDAHFQRLTTHNGLAGDRVGAWFQAFDGGIWLGIDHGGLARLRERHFQVIGPAEGLPARSALSVCQTKDGAVWMGTSGGGLCRWQDGTMTRFDVGSNRAADFVFSVFPQSDGGLWLSAGSEDLRQFKDGKIGPAPWEEHGIKAILTDHAGRVWTGSKSRLAWWSATARRSFGPADGMTVSPVRTLVEAPDGVVWCGADDGSLYRCEPDHLQVFRPKDTAADQPILSLLADKDGVIWAGTFRGGLLRFKGGKFSRITAKQGLYADVIGQLLEDDQNRLWMGTHRGIFCISKGELDDCADGKSKTLNCVTYGRLDGLPTLEFADNYQPACWKGNDGRLWFTTIRGVVSVRPEELTTHSAPTPVVIEEVRVDGELLPLNAGKLTIPPGHKQFEFRFTALGFDAPDKTRFRCRIEGLDNDWVECDTRRTAHYGNLAPNDYKFRVTACSSQGAWNEAGASLNFTVRPNFYQTWWFKVVTGVLILGASAGIARIAVVRKYRRRLAQIEQQHAVERDRARIAQDIHDDIGAGLTQITLLSELAKREPAEIGGHLDRISTSARHLTRSMDEIVWAVDPQHDTFNGLIDYISAFAEDFLRVAGIRCRMEVPGALPNLRIEAELRYNLFLAVKETLNNVVKHSHATEVWLRLRIEGSGFTLTIEDNGCGYNGSSGAKSILNGDRLANGSGLHNLEKRLTSVGGRCVVRNVAGTGMRIDMTIHLNGASSPIVAIGRNGNSR